MRLDPDMIGDRLREAGLYPDVINEIKECIIVKNEWVDIMREKGY